MPAIALSRRHNALDVAWGVFALGNLAAMEIVPDWETIPFHLIWISLTLLYGFRVWRLGVTFGVLAAVGASTGALISADAFSGSQLWGELFEVPLMSAMFLAMVWHARRRQEALAAVEREAAERASLLERQERFLHDASHELRTPMTIAQGHLELLRRTADGDIVEVEVALDELKRMEGIIDRLLLLANAGQPDFLVLDDIDVEPFLEDVFLRWSEIAPRSWNLGPVPRGSVRADVDAIRIILDALLENAVEHTKVGESIDLRARATASQLVIDVADEGCGIAPDAVAKIFDRFARADPARTRTHGGVGLGLAIVDALVKAHGGRCTVETGESGTTFSLRLPRFHSTPQLAHVSQATLLPVS